MLLTVRNKKGVEAFNYDLHTKMLYPLEALISDVNVRLTKWNGTGKYLAAVLPQELVIFVFLEKSLKEFCRINIPCVDIVWSPSGKYLGTYEKPRMLL